MWKDFFYFTKSEQRGFAFFVLLVTGVSGGVFLYSEWCNKMQQIASPPRRVPPPDINKYPPAPPGDIYLLFVYLFARAYVIITYCSKTDPT